MFFFVYFHFSDMEMLYSVEAKPYQGLQQNSSNYSFQSKRSLKQVWWVIGFHLQRCIFTISIAINIKQSKWDIKNVVKTKKNLSLS